MILNSAKLKKYRDAKLLTQEEIAYNLGVSQTTVSEWEKKDSNVKLEHIINLSKVLDVGLEDIINEPGSIININNQNNNKISSNAVVGFNVQTQIIDLQSDLIKQLKKQILSLEEELSKLKSSIK